VTPFWCCPQCRGALRSNPTELGCSSCEARYPVVAEVPDLRLSRAAWIDFGRDRDRAEAIERRIQEAGLEQALLAVFRESRGFGPSKAAYRARQVLAGIRKGESLLREWEAGIRETPVVDVGCGPGQLLAAAARRGIPMAGTDVSLEWLVVAKHLVRREGAEPVLAGGVAEQLPLPNGSVGCVIALDVVEHVGDQSAFVGEIRRVLRPEGRFLLACPNRFSLSPEPHVGVWGVGYLPVRWQAWWVKLWSGQGYSFTRLLSKFEILGLIRRAGGLEATVQFPVIVGEDLALFPPWKALLARMYNAVVAWRWTQPLLAFFGAYYRVWGRRHGL
jgi:2-polyprenyl-3-methyl-5-hydroxy-6-metoxy-1,4-benzoquinol methylase